MKPAFAAIASILSFTASFSAFAQAAKPVADLTKGQAKAQEVCIACHTFDGSRGLSANPILQGQHAEYLSKQLHDFKSGKRANAIMAGMAGPLTEEDIANVTAFYASKAPVTGTASKADLVRLGERIYKGGITAKGVPACAACHSPNGAGLPVQFPRLAGQNAEYAESQLKAFRDGLRTNHPTMNGVAANMNDKEISAVADYMAGLR